jgi:transposase
VVLTLGPVERFASARKVASYIGLIPAKHSSGARQRLGHLSKEGNVFLRWVLVEAATVAVRHDPEFKRRYWRLVERRGKPIAKVAMARKLLVASTGCAPTKREPRSSSAQPRHRQARGLIWPQQGRYLE